MLISDAFAQAATPAQNDSSLISLLPMIVILVLFYFLLIRPQSKRAKEHKQMVSALQRGDEVITNGGILGQIVNVSESYAIVEIVPGMEVTVLKSSIQTLLPKGTLRSIEPKNKTQKEKAKTPKSGAGDTKEENESVVEASENKDDETSKK